MKEISGSKVILLELNGLQNSKGMGFAEQSWPLPSPAPTGTWLLHPPRACACACTSASASAGAILARPGRRPRGGCAQLLGGGAYMTMAGELESSKSLSGLLSGLAQKDFHGHPGITEELLRSQLYPEVPPEEFRPFLAKMRGILKVPLLPAASALEPSPSPSFQIRLPAPPILPPSLPKLKRLSSSDFSTGATGPLQNRGAGSVVSSLS